MKIESRIYIAGHRGMVGSSILRALQAKGYSNFILKTSSELDLRNQQAVADFFAIEKPDYVFLAAAKVGGILSNNTYRADFIYENLMIQSNVIHQSYMNGLFWYIDGYINGCLIIIKFFLVIILKLIKLFNI